MRACKCAMDWTVRIDAMNAATSRLDHHPRLRAPIRAQMCRNTHGVWIGMLAALVTSSSLFPMNARAETTWIEAECAARLSEASPRDEATQDGSSLSIDLAEVRRRVIAGSPALAADCEVISERTAQVVQAGVRPNPEIEVELEEFAGTGDLAGVDAAEVTLMARQVIETAGKREKRRRVALTARELALVDYQIDRAELLGAAEVAFVGVLAAQSRIELQSEIIRAARASVESTARLVAAGAASPVESIRADVELAAAEVERASGAHALAAARARLAATWAGATDELGRAEGSLPEPARIESGEPESSIDASPRLARLSLEIDRRRAVVALEDSRATPDVTVAAGLRRLEELDDTAFVAAVSVPLPSFDRNQGERAAARARVRSARHERAAMLAHLTAERARLAAERETRANEAIQLRDRILPNAERAFEGVRRGYAQGRFRSLDVIEARRRLFELRLREIDALSAHATLGAELRRLVAVAPGTGE